MTCSPASTVFVDVQGIDELADLFDTVAGPSALSPGFVNGETDGGWIVAPEVSSAPPRPGGRAWLAKLWWSIARRRD